MSIANTNSFNRLSLVKRPHVWSQRVLDSKNEGIADEVINTLACMGPVSHAVAFWSYVTAVSSRTLWLREKVIRLCSCAMRSQTTTAAASGVANPQMEMNICFSLGFAPALRVETVADRYIFMNLHHSCNIYIYIYIYIYCTASDNLLWKCISACNFVCSSERLTL